MVKLFVPRSLILHLGGVGLIFIIGLTLCICNAQENVNINLYANEDWYVNYVADEMELGGEIIKVRQPLGPNTRNFTYIFQNEQDTLPIYDPQNLLQKIITRKSNVKISCKIVDLSNEGFSREIWIGFIIE